MSTITATIPAGMSVPAVGTTGYLFTHETRRSGRRTLRQVRFSVSGASAGPDYQYPDGRVVAIRDIRPAQVVSVGAADEYGDVKITTTLVR